MDASIMVEKNRFYHITFNFQWWIKTRSLTDNSDIPYYVNIKYQYFMLFVKILLMEEKQFFFQTIQRVIFFST